MSHKVPFHSNFVEKYSDECVSLQEDGMTTNGFKTFATPELSIIDKKFRFQLKDK
jgi:hypothetical protein